MKSSQIWFHHFKIKDHAEHLTLQFFFFIFSLTLSIYIHLFLLIRSCHHHHHYILSTVNLHLQTFLSNLLQIVLQQSQHGPLSSQYGFFSTSFNSTLFILTLFTIQTNKKQGQQQRQLVALDSGFTMKETIKICQPKQPKILLNTQVYLIIKAK